MKIDMKNLKLITLWQQRYCRYLRKYVNNLNFFHNCDKKSNLIKFFVYVLTLNLYFNFLLHFKLNYFKYYSPIPQLMGKKNLSYDDIPNEPMNNSNSDEGSDEESSSSDHSIFIRNEDPDEQEESSKENPLSKGNSNFRRYENSDEKDESFEQNPRAKEYFIFSRYEDSDEQEGSSE